jgi:hypothetical protein
MRNLCNLEKGEAVDQKPSDTVVLHRSLLRVRKQVIARQLMCGRSSKPCGWGLCVLIDFVALGDVSEVRK